MATVKFYKILNLSAAAGLVVKAEDKLIIKPNDVYNKVSLAPSWGATVMWADTLARLSSLRIPERENWVFIAEIELDDSVIVEGCFDALHLDKAEFKEMTADRAVSTLTYKDWTYGPYNDFYGVRPEVRVDGPVEVKKLYKIKKRAILNIAAQAPMIDHEIEEMNVEWYIEMSDEEFRRMEEEKEKDLEKWINNFHKNVENLKKGLLPTTYEEMMGSLDLKIEVNNDRIKRTVVDDSWSYSDPTRFLAAVICVQNGAEIDSCGSVPFLDHVLYNSYPVQYMREKDRKYNGTTRYLLKNARKLPDAVELLNVYKDPLKVLEELNKYL